MFNVSSPSNLLVSPPLRYTVPTSMVNLSSDSCSTVLHFVAARRPATGGSQGVQYPITRSLNIVNTLNHISCITHIGIRRWNVSDRTACESSIKAKQKKNGPLGMIQ
jgi:hypothetical protein